MMFLFLILSLTDQKNDDEMPIIIQDYVSYFINKVLGIVEGFLKFIRNLLHKLSILGSFKTIPSKIKHYIYRVYTFYSQIVITKVQNYANKGIEMFKPSHDEYLTQYKEFREKCEKKTQ